MCLACYFDCLHIFIFFAAQDEVFVCDINFLMQFMFSFQRSTDRTRMSKRLTEEAEKYIEDFISNVEDTDISSLDGERSDTSSSLGGITKTEISHSPAVTVPLPVEMDGVVLPWLQWETSNEATPLPYKNKMDPPVTPKTISWDAAQVLLELLILYRKLSIPSAK